MLRLCALTAAFMMFVGGVNGAHSFRPYKSPFDGAPPPAYNPFGHPDAGYRARTLPSAPYAGDDSLSDQSVENALKVFSLLADGDLETYELFIENENALKLDQVLKKFSRRTFWSGELKARQCLRKANKHYRKKKLTQARINTSQEKDNEKRAKRGKL
jgi:hypothetical protein